MLGFKEQEIMQAPKMKQNVKWRPLMSFRGRVQAGKMNAYLGGGKTAVVASLGSWDSENKVAGRGKSRPSVDEGGPPR